MSILILDIPISLLYSYYTAKLSLTQWFDPSGYGLTHATSRQAIEPQGWSPFPQPQFVNDWGGDRGWGSSQVKKISRTPTVNRTSPCHIWVRVYMKIISEWMQLITHERAYPVIQYTVQYNHINFYPYKIKMNICCTYAELRSCATLVGIFVGLISNFPLCNEICLAYVKQRLGRRNCLWYVKYNTGKCWDYPRNSVGIIRIAADRSAPWFTHSCSRILSPCLGDEAGYGVGLPYRRPAT